MKGTIFAGYVTVETQRSCGFQSIFPTSTVELLLSTDLHPNFLTPITHRLPRDDRRDREQQTLLKSINTCLGTTCQGSV